MLKRIAKRITREFGFRIIKADPVGDDKSVERELLRLRKLPPGIGTTTSILGAKLSIPCPRTFGYLYKEIWEREIYSIPISAKKIRMIDCGANIGLASIYIKSHFPDAEITAVEPDPAIYEMLQANLRAMGHTDVVLIQAAVTGFGETCLFTPDTGGTGGRIGEEGLSAPATRLSSLLKDEVDFLKIDIEGAEVDVIVEAASHLKKVRFLFVEYHSLVGREQHLSRLLTVLENAGFRCFCETGGPVPERPFVEKKVHKGFDNLVNIFAERTP